MRSLLLACGSAAFLLLAAFSFSPAAPAGPGAIEDLLRGFLGAVDRGDHEAAKRCFAGVDARFPVLLWDLDFARSPVAVQGATAAAKHLDDLLDGATKAKAKITTRIVAVHADCHSAELGYATVEFDRTVTIDGKSDTARCRATALVTMGEQGQWRVFHWHASRVPAAEQPTK